MKEQAEKLTKLLINPDVFVNVGIINKHNDNVEIINDLVDEMPDDTRIVIINKDNEINKENLSNKKNLKVSLYSKYDGNELIVDMLKNVKQAIFTTSNYIRENPIKIRDIMCCGNKVVFCSRVNSPEDLINRFTAKCAMDEIENTYEYLENLSAKLINVIISYGIDKTDNILKVLDITEVILSDNKILYNPLFKLNFKEEKNEIKSFYERTGNISKKIERSLLLAGYSFEDFSEFI